MLMFSFANWLQAQGSKCTTGKILKKKKKKIIGIKLPVLKNYTECDRKM